MGLTHPSGVTAVVVSHDSAAVLADCLAALRREGCAVLVVDNASGDGSADLAERLGARVLRLPRNEGFGRAMNRGVAAAGTEFCLLTNPDLTYAPGAVTALLAAAARWPDAGLLAPRIVEPDGRVFWQSNPLLAPGRRVARRDAALPEGECCATFLSGASLLVRCAVFLAHGGFDPEIFLFYEDDDLCRRMRDAGRALVHVHGAVAAHRRGGSTAPAPGRVFRARWHLAWSRCYVSRKWGLADPSAGLLLTAAPKFAAAVLTGRPAAMERHHGTLAGAWAWRNGRKAWGESTAGLLPEGVGAPT